MIKQRCVYIASGVVLLAGLTACGDPPTVPTAEPAASPSPAAVEESPSGYPAPVPVAPEQAPAPTEESPSGYPAQAPVVPESYPAPSPSP